MSAQKRARAFSCPRFEFAVAQWRWRGRAPPPWAICAFFGRFSTNSPKNSPRAGQRSSNPHTNHGAAHLGPLYRRFSVIFRSFKTGLAGVDLPAFSFCLLAPSTARTPPPAWRSATSGVERAIRQLIIGISDRIGASWPSEPTRDALYYHGTTQKRPRAAWCVTNTDTQPTTPLRRCRLNLYLRLSARHTTRTRRVPRRAP